MYPSGYTLVDNNQPYLEREDELDRPVRPTTGSEEETDDAAMDLEDEVMDIEGVSDDDDTDGALMEKKMWLPLTIGAQVRD